MAVIVLAWCCPGCEAGADVGPMEYDAAVVVVQEWVKAHTCHTDGEMVLMD